MKALDIGDVIGRTFSVWGRRAVPLGVLTAALLLPQVLITLALLDTMEWMQQPDPAMFESSSDVLTKSFQTIGWSALALLVVWITQTLIVGTTVHLSLADLEGRPCSLGASIKAASRHFIPVGILVLLINTALGCLCVPFLVICAYFYPSIPAIMAERCGLGAAFARGAALSEGNRWRCLLIAALFLFMLYAIRVPFVVIGTIYPGDMAQFLGVIPSAIGVPLEATAAAVTYHVLVTNREGGRHDTLAEVFA